MQFSKLLTVFTTLASMALATDGTRSVSKGCSFNSNVDLIPGFKARFFEYELDNHVSFTDKAFYGSGYTEGSAYGTATGVTDPNFSNMFHAIFIWCFHI
ncbi:unnamed protein product [Ambrosiozyma monospora]|uniref:Unnamed protein product n=1 Tax=Ambrosiozyma monospora TaxID=43982 RepID=A0ACB5UCL4_AMBMO|nr:unnamed protein product [Ambrosiozyma monospora]